MIRLAKNASITLDLRSNVVINNILFYQGVYGSDALADMMYDYSIYISSDNTNWEKVGEDTYHDKKEIILDISSSPKTARYVKIVSNWDLECWVYVREFSVNQEVH